MQGKILRKFSFCLGILALICGAAAAQPAFTALGTEESSAVAARNEKSLRAMKANRHVKSSKLVKFDPLILNSTTIHLPFKGAMKIRKKKDVLDGRGVRTWIGETEDGGEAIFINNGGSVAGVVNVSGRIYEITTLSPGVQVILEIDPALLPEDHPPLKKAPFSPPLGEQAGVGSRDQSVGTSSDNYSTAASADGDSPTLDILFVYTPLAESRYGGQVDAKFDLIIARLNESFANSGVNLRAAKSGKLRYAKDYTSLSTARLEISQALEVIRYRDQIKADVIAVIVGQNNPPYCGEALVLAGPADAYAVSEASCALNSYSLSHEIGHLMGAVHNVDVSNKYVPFSYGHGSWWAVYDIHSREGTCQRSIMSYWFDTEPRYDIKCNTFDRVNRWSNPNKSIMLESAWLATGDSTCCHDARVLNEQGPRFARYGDTQIYPKSSIFTTIMGVLSILLEH